MDWLFGHHWTPGWGALLTAVITPVVTLTGVWLTLRNQDKRYRLERSDKTHADVRTTVAELLAAKSSWDAAMGGIYDLALVPGGLRPGELPEGYWDLVESALFGLGRGAKPVQALCSRVGLHTKDESLLKATDALDALLGGRLVRLASQVRHPSQRDIGADLTRVYDLQNDVEIAFSNLEKAARKRLAVAPDGK